jgi:hypothetical protein
MSNNEGKSTQFKTNLTTIITKLVHKFEVQSLKWEYFTRSESMNFHNEK